MWSEMEDRGRFGWVFGLMTSGRDGVLVGDYGLWTIWMNGFELWIVPSLGDLWTIQSLGSRIQEVGSCSYEVCATSFARGIDETHWTYALEAVVTDGHESQLGATNDYLHYLF